MFSIAIGCKGRPLDIDGKVLQDFSGKNARLKRME
jgi:hypothetical protein